MRNIFLLNILIAITFCACDTTTTNVPISADFQILPQPKKIQSGSNQLVLSPVTELYTSNKELIPLMELFSNEIFRAREVQFSISDRKNRKSDIIFMIDTILAKEMRV